MTSQELKTTDLPQLSLFPFFPVTKPVSQGQSLDHQQKSACTFTSSKAQMLQHICCTRHDLEEKQLFHGYSSVADYTVGPPKGRYQVDAVR